jgi:chromosome segregation ATPase
MSLIRPTPCRTCGKEVELSEMDTHGCCRDCVRDSYPDARDAEIVALKSERDALAERVEEAERERDYYISCHAQACHEVESAEKALAEMTRDIAHLRREAGPDSCAALAEENANLREVNAVQSRTMAGLVEALDRARAALKPFADAAQMAARDTKLPVSDRIVLSNEPRFYAASEDFRRAAQALNPEKGA